MFNKELSHLNFLKLNQPEKVFLRFYRIKQKITLLQTDHPVKIPDFEKPARRKGIKKADQFVLIRSF